MDYVEKLFINTNKLKYSLKYINIVCENLIYSLFKSMQTDYRYNCIDYLYHHKKRKKKNDIFLRTNKKKYDIWIIIMSNKYAYEASNIRLD